MVRNTLQLVLLVITGTWFTIDFSKWLAFMADAAV